MNLSELTLDREGLTAAIACEDAAFETALREEAYRVKVATIGPEVYLRGLIEISNICVKNCLYCGIRRDIRCQRYELSEEEVLATARVAARRRFGSVVIQGGERTDAAFIRKISRLLKAIKSIDLSTGVPEGMAFSKDTGLFYRQYDLDYQVQGNGEHVIKADRLKLNLYFDIHKRADDLARVQMAITTQSEVVQAVFEAGKPVPKEDRDAFRKENNFMKIAFWKSGKVRSFDVDKDAVKKATLTSGFFASKTLGLDLDPMEAKSRYGMRDEQEKTFMLQKGPLGEDRLRVCTESSKHGRMFICFVALILASYIRHIRDTKPELTKAFPSMASILEEMQTIRCIEHDGHRKFITPFVGDQITLCDAFGFEIPEGCRPTYTSRKSAKGKRGRPPKPQVETS